MKKLLVSAVVLHADETPDHTAGSLAYVHVARTEYLRLMHVGDRSANTIDAGGVLPGFTGVLVRDGYAGYQHLEALHAWCGAHLLRDLRSISDADHDGQLWAQAMATKLLQAHHAASTARDNGAEALDEGPPSRTSPCPHRRRAAINWLARRNGEFSVLTTGRSRPAS
jgi:transposase